MRVFMPVPNEGWITDVITAEFRRHTRHQFVDRIEDADVIWMYSKWIANHYPIHILRSKPCITTVHHIVPGKGLDIGYFDNFTDVYHVPNLMTERDLRGLTSKPIVRLPYWVPTAFEWSPEVPPGFRFEGGTLTFGSFQRDTEGSTIRGPDPRPKLEKGPDVLVRLLNERFATDDYRLILSGWRRQYVKAHVPPQRILDLSGHGDIKGMSDHQHVNYLYNRLRQIDGIYLVTSRYEGGPQAVLEAAINETRILSTSVGIAPEVLHPDCICGSADDPATLDAFERKIRGDIDWDRVLDYNLLAARSLAIENVISRYDALVERVHAEK